MEKSKHNITIQPEHIMHDVPEKSSAKIQ